MVGYRSPLPPPLPATSTCQASTGLELHSCVPEVAGVLCAWWKNNLCAWWTREVPVNIWLEQEARRQGTDSGSQAGWAGFGQAGWQPPPLLPGQSPPDRPEVIYG